VTAPAAQSVEVPVPFGGLGIIGFSILIAGVFIVLGVLVLIFVLVLRTKVRRENERALAEAERRRRRRRRQQQKEQPIPTHQVEVKKKKTPNGKVRVVTETLNVGHLDDEAAEQLAVSSDDDSE
jgi:type II secretory pathway pseudopilin PulG